MAVSLAKVVKNTFSPVYAFRAHNKEKIMKKKMTGRQIVQVFADLLEEIPPPETPEEVDAELRAAGLDPEQIGRETVALVEEFSREAHERLEKCTD